MKRPRGRPRKRKDAIRFGGVFIETPKRAVGRPKGSAKYWRDMLARTAPTLDRLAPIILGTATARDRQQRDTEWRRYVIAERVRELHQQGIALGAAIDTVARDGASFGNDRYFASPASVRRAWREYRELNFGEFREKS